MSAVLLKFALCIPFIVSETALANDGILDCLEETITSELVVGPTWRGNNFSDFAGKVSADISCAGFSGGIDAGSFEDNGNLFQLFISYSYALEKATISTGIQHFVQYPSKINSETSELFIEVEGRQEVLGFIPKFHYAKGLANNSGDYLSIRLSKDFYTNELLVNPYAEYALGSYYSGNFKSNNLRFGVDVVRPIGEELYLSPNIALNIPLASVKEFNSSAKTSIEIGLALRKDF